MRSSCLVVIVVLFTGYCQGQLGQDLNLFNNLPVSAPAWVVDNGRNKTFWTSATTKVTPHCWADIQTYIADLATGKRWALQMADSYGGRTSGWASGNTLSEGHYDQCVGVHAGRTGSNGRPLTGKYCTTYWAYSEGESFVLLGAGLCVPSSCHYSDIYWIMKNIGPPDSDFAWPYPVSVPFTRTSYCSEPKPPMIKDGSAIAATVILSILGLCAAIGTLFDNITYNKRHDVNWSTKKTKKKKKSKKSKKSKQSSIKPSSDANNQLEMRATTDGANGELTHRKEQPAESSEEESDEDSSTKPPEKYVPKTWESVLLSFSVVENAPRMLSFDHPPGSFRCLNAIRFLSMCWIVLGHTWQLGLTITKSATMENSPKMAELTAQPKGFVLNYSNITVESFFILSAMLTTIGFMRQLKRNNDRASCVHFGLYYFHRFWRLTPVYMILLMIWTVFFPYVTGPMFPDDLPEWTSCRTQWWRNLLYIQNFGNYELISCMGWTWYLANDFQFYVFAPVLICLLYWKRPAGIAMTATLIGISILIMGGLAFAVHGLRTLDYFYEWYSMPWCRCSTYFLGIFLGYLVFKTDCKVKISTGGVVGAWIGAVICLQISLFPGPGWAYILFEMYQRPVFGLAIFWIIFACLTGYAGFINSILSWRGWVPLARLTYTGYLIHPMLVYYTYYSSRRQVYITQWYLAYNFLATLVMTLFFSFIASLLFEMPFLNLEKIMFKNVNRTPHAKRETEETASA